MCKIWLQLVHFRMKKTPISLTLLVLFCPQAVFSSVFYFASVPLYQGFLIIGWDTNWMAMTYQQSIWLPCFTGISSVLKHCWNVRGGNMKVVTDAFHCWSWQQNVWNVLCMCCLIVSVFSTLRSHDCLFQLLHHLHHVPCLLPGAGQRCQVRGCHVIPRTVQRSLEGI